MKNIKFVAICAACGFVLSLVCGFFSHSSFGRILLIALIFGIIFGGISFGISIVYDKFLDIDGYSDMSASTQTDSTSGNKTLGQHVDLIIQEEELEQSGNQNHYDVGENHQMLNESDYKKGEKADVLNEDGSPHIEEKNEFVPIRNLETVTNFSSSESMTPKESDERREIIAEQNAKKGEDLDVLPDMSDLKIASDSSSPDTETVVFSDSEEENFVHSATNYKSSESSAGEIKDASLMAKAISSILAEES